MRASNSLRLTVLLLFAALVKAAEYTLHNTDEDRQRCSGMYGPRAWGGRVSPFIEVKFVPDPPANDDEAKDIDDWAVSLLIFEYKDEHLIGVDGTDEDGRKTTIVTCSNEAIANKICKQSQLGMFLLQPKWNKTATSQIIATRVNVKDGKPIHYEIKKTGFYCVATWGYAARHYTGVVEFRNAYGELPASQIPKLPFYGGITILYALIGVFWGFLYVQHRRDILPVQNYITAIIIFLIVEMLMTWGFYDYMNLHGSDVVAKVFMVIVAVLNAGRNSFSFFLLLIVCMGYGVVKPSLGSLMWYCRALALAHFIFGVIYSVASLAIVSPETAGPLVLFVILPLAATLTAFYVWTLNSLNLTMKELLDRKQNVKALMYRRLWWVLLGSIIVIFGFFFINSLTFAGTGSPDFVPTHWQTRWFVLDGWLNLVYLVDLAVIAYLWRPTLNNRRFAMSDEIAQDDDGFEIASMEGSDEDEENGRMGGPPVGGHQPLPRDSFDQRHSGEGEAIFSVGDDLDRWSEDGSDSDDGEDKKLAKGKGKDK
ncbi:hypothetical protein TWF696_006292 [Orbilia brochopaga]|uniref:Uncharacterized protein n=1 Tax=Orbilia brochopaga TaxID=3140254 RepID=A0AAV9UZ34_9PEZI